VTDKWDDFETIADSFDMNTRGGVKPSPGELKYRTSDDGMRGEILEDIAKLKSNKGASEMEPPYST
jgi:hypothetical protein